jgi:hypothetical protein
MGLAVAADIFVREVEELTMNRYNREGGRFVVSGDIILLFLTPGFG